MKYCILKILINLFVFKNSESRFTGLQKLCMLNATQSFVYNIVILLFRNHLFIWSVFSPKLLYVVAFTSTTFIFSALIVVLFSLCRTPTIKEFKI